MDGKLAEASSEEQTIHQILGLEKENKPIFLYLASSDSEHGATSKKIEGTVLKDERVCIGAKFFTLVKVPWTRTDERIAQLIRKKDVPTLAFFLRSGKCAGLIQAKHSPSKVFGIMKTVVKKDYKGVKLDATVKKLQKILTEIDKIDAERKTLKTAGKKGNLTAAQKREIEEKTTALAEKEKELDKDEAEFWKEVFKEFEGAKKAE